MKTEPMHSPLESHESLGDALGIRLLVKRDDLLPFPLAGNKVRKLLAELDSLEVPPDLVISNGAMASNHCRTLAFIAARRGIRVHLVLHGGVDDRASAALRLLGDLNASFSVVDPSQISSTIRAVAEDGLSRRERVHVIAGGCHTPAGAAAYRRATVQLLDVCTPDAIVLASGTGATQGGIVAGAALRTSSCVVIGVSVARATSRGVGPVREAARWAGASDDVPITFLDGYRDGGYGLHGATTDAAVRMGWRHGLPLDPVYTGKAFAGLLDLLRLGRLTKGTTVLLWHTGGLANYLLAEAAPTAP